MLKKKAYKSENGFTLVELMICVAILSILAVPMIYLETGFYERYHKTKAWLGMVEDGHRTIEWMAKDVRGASSVDRVSAELILLNYPPGKNRAIEYRFEKKKKVLIRVEKLIDINKTISEIMIAQYIDTVSLNKVESGSGLFEIQLTFSRQFFHSSETVLLNRIIGTRIF